MEVKIFTRELFRAKLEGILHLRLSCPSYCLHHSRSQEQAILSWNPLHVYDGNITTVVRF